MRIVRQKRTHESVWEKMSFSEKLYSILSLAVLIPTIYLVASFTPLTKDEHIESFEKLNENVEPFRRNLTECARQVKATMVEIERFLKRIPQESMQGKCFVACILKRNKIITNNKINTKNLLEANKAVYGEDSEVLARMAAAVSECVQVLDGIFEVCEYASVFNDCMHMKMEHILDKVTMERRMEALGQMTGDPDNWADDDEEMLQLMKDEL